MSGMQHKGLTGSRQPNRVSQVGGHLLPSLPSPPPSLPPTSLSAFHRALCAMLRTCPGNIPMAERRAHTPGAHRGDERQVK